MGSCEHIGFVISVPSCVDSHADCCSDVAGVIIVCYGSSSDSYAKLISLRDLYNFLRGLVAS